MSTAAQPASGRIVCSRCGANNFNTQAACWKCGAPLQAGAVAGPAVPSPPSATAIPRQPSSASAAQPLSASPSLYSNALDPSVAVWAGIALAVFFPFLAVPVGIVFLMLDDRRRAEVGRITLIWGLIMSLGQTLVTAALLKGPYDLVKSVMSSGRLPAPAPPNANDVVPSQGLPPGFK